MDLAGNMDDELDYGKEEEEKRAPVSARKGKKKKRGARTGRRQLAYSTQQIRAAPAQILSMCAAPNPFLARLIHGQLPILLQFPSLSSFSSLTTRRLSPSRIPAAATASPGGWPSVLQSSRPGSGGGTGDLEVQEVAWSMRGEWEVMASR
ncbi:hypothetical protein TRIUR3_19003 [Triticum urartu]|uniref:Uncharacterized protein n=1 Tax=Triticum urartu TaxID=4572 RepID=M7YTF3_TRIUA|nr:hypothetical protein TRIUR3_19003 [Triticum urartu]